MLKKLRKRKTSKRILIGLAIIIVPAFAFWGFSSVLHGPQESLYVGKIYGKKITLIEYKDALEAIRNLALIQYGDKFSEVAPSLDLDGQAWDRLILLAEAKKRNLNASDKEVVEFIASYPFFQNKGTFDQRTYNEMLQYVFRTQPRAFEEQTRQNLVISKLYKGLTDKMAVDESEIKNEYRKMQEEISLNFISANPLDFIKDISANDKEILDYFQKNPLQFKKPLSFNIEYVFLAKDTQNAEKQIRELFRELKRGKDFDKIAKDFGLEKKETGLFAENDPIPGIGWSPQVTILISKTSAGKYLTPLVLDKYYYILKVKERKEPYIPDFALIKDKVKEAYLKDESKIIAQEKINACLKKIKALAITNPKTVNFETEAKALGIKSGSTGLFKFGSYIEGIGASDIFWTTAENLKDGEFSEIIETPSGFFIIKVKNRSQPDEKKFAAEKNNFGALFLLQKKQEYFTQFLETLKTKTQRF